MSGQATRRRVTFCRYDQKANRYTHEYLTRDLELFQASKLGRERSPKGERERERRKIKSKKLIEFYRGPVYPRPHIHASTSYGNTQRGLRVCAGTACGKARGTVVCVFSSRLAEHTYGGHFRCDGVINGN